MEYELNFHTFKNIVNIKYQLMNYAIEDIKLYYHNAKRYRLFVNAITLLLNINAEFFLLDSSMIEKVQDVISTYRFQNSMSDKETKQLINFIISQMNIIEHLSEQTKRQLLTIYIKIEEQLRGISLRDADDCLQAISNDTLVLHSLINHNFSKIDDIYLLSSINYFLWYYPNLYLDTSIQQPLLNQIDETINNAKWYESKKVKSYKFTKSRIQQINEKKKD